MIVAEFPDNSSSVALCLSSRFSYTASRLFNLAMSRLSRETMMKYGTPASMLLDDDSID